MMSEYTLDEGAIPPWILEDSSNGSQISAGDYTLSNDRNKHAIPEPGETIANEAGSMSASQNQNIDDSAVVRDYPKTPASGVTIASPKPPKKPTPRTRRVKIDEPKLISYKVRRGDNLTVIARRSGTTVSAIRKASGIKGSTIYTGQTIKVPYTPQSYRLKKSSKSSRYTVRRGDTISVIASRKGISTSALLRANNMTNADARRLSIGKRLVIPKR